MTYRIDVCPQGFREYAEARSEDLNELLGKLEAMKTASHGDGPVFPDDDVLEIVEELAPVADGVEPGFTTLLSWSRDGGEVYHEGGIVGWQLVNADGVNIHGEDADPFGLQSFEILIGDAAVEARGGAVSGGYLVRPVRAGDIENPTVVEILRSATPGVRP